MEQKNMVRPDRRDWTEKYRPEHLSDIVGNTSAVRQIAEWAKNWNLSSKPLLLYGKPGTGKTSTAYALAGDMGWEVIELNASDQRTKAAIERIAGAGSTTGSLTGANRKLIIFDEADNLHGNADRGGAKAIVSVIRQTRHPVILIANDAYSLDAAIRKLCVQVQFKALQARSLVPQLRFICASEGVECSGEALAEIAGNAAGDMRAAVTMLYASAAGREEITTDDVRASRKDERASIFDLISAVFKGQKDDSGLIRIAIDLPETPDTIEQWLEGALIHLPDDAARKKAYDSLVQADVFLGRTYIRQYYSLWKYASALMLIGTSNAASGCGIHERIMPPSRWRRMNTARRQKAVRNTVLGRISERYHIPGGAARGEYLSYISLIADEDPVSIAKDLELDQDELEFFTGDRKKAKEVLSKISQEEKEEAETGQNAGDSKEEMTKKSAHEESAPEEPQKKAEKTTQSTLF